MDRTSVCGTGDPGSIPGEGTLNELNDFEEAKEWACLRHAHAVSPVFAKEFKECWVAPPRAVRTVFSPRRRFASNTIFSICFVRNTKRIFI